ncbi:MAG: iron-containing alcohol dehydrogenase [Chloroflexota bacterium]|nr:iron-containing alcohol dehydrogenase [Chloroflexota bacterium]
MSAGPPFAFSLETEISFGVGVRSKVGEAARRFGQRVAVVAGEHAFLRSPFRAEIEAALRHSQVEIVVTCPSMGEPTLEETIATGAAIRLARAEVVVAVGGGSVLDLAKAAAIAALEGMDLGALAAGQRFDSTALPVIALPTTAGSGAEVSRGAIVLDEAAGNKRGIRGAGVAPRVALVDPQLVVSCPRSVSAMAGFDAVAHAVETSLSRAATPITQLLSVEALRHLLSEVPRSLDYPDDLRSRSSASYGALLMGINLANSTTCLPHRMQYPVGALTRTEHALGVAALTRAWLWRSLEFAPDRVARLAPAIGDDVSDAASVVEAILNFMSTLDLRPRLRDLGVRRDQLGRLTEMVEGAVENDPGPSDRAAILELYEASY